MTQSQSILEHLQNGGTLTVAQALNQFGVYALSQRVGELRRKGYAIKDQWVEQNGKRFKRYLMEVSTELEFK
jgi:hypothetical protein